MITEELDNLIARLKSMEWQLDCNDCPILSDCETEECVLHYAVKAIDTLREDKAALEVLDSCACWWAHDQMELIPAADVRPVRRGKWVGYPECLKYPNAYSDDHIVCSACEECFSILDNDCERFNFCPNCGADMREPLKGTDMGGGIRRDDAGNVIDWGITGPPGDVGKTEEE